MERGAEAEVEASQLEEGQPPPDVRALHRTARMVRVGFLAGPVLRYAVADTLLAFDAEYGRVNGFAVAFHTSFIVATQRLSVGVLDVPIGVGGVLRGRLRDFPLYGSVGLSAGVLVHRAKLADPDDERVVHRVDPDFRVPLRLSWTIATMGLSMAVVQGYSIRTRTYEERGAASWRRHAYRIALLLGLHFDVNVGRAKERPRRGRL